MKYGLFEAAASNYDVNLRSIRRAGRERPHHLYFLRNPTALEIFVKEITFKDDMIFPEGVNE